MTFNQLGLIARRCDEAAAESQTTLRIAGDDRRGAEARQSRIITRPMSDSGGDCEATTGCIPLGSCLHIL